MAGDLAIWFRSVLYQTNEGLILECFAHPRVEDYFKVLGKPAEVSVYCQQSRSRWFSPDGKELLVYPYNGGGGGTRDDEYGEGYSLSPVGYDFNSHNEDFGFPENTFNLAFLRIAGISKEGGIKLGIKQPSSKKGRVNIRSNMEKAVRKFIRNTISSSRLELVIQGREII